MELKELVQDLTIACVDEVCEAVRKNYFDADFKWFVGDGFFLVNCFEHNESVTIECYDNDCKQKNVPLLCAFLKKKLEEHDFWDDAYNAYPQDENPNPGLDPAFSSWDDYFDYVYH